MNEALGPVNRVIARRLAEFVDRGPEMTVLRKLRDDLGLAGC